MCMKILKIEESFDNVEDHRLIENSCRTVKIKYCLIDRKFRYFALEFEFI